MERWQRYCYPSRQGAQCQKNRDVWTLAELSKIYNKYSFGNKKSPNTGVDSYEIVDNQTGVTTPITDDAVDTTTTQGSQTGKYILVMVVGALVAVAAVLGVYIWSRKKKQEEE